MPSCLVHLPKPFKASISTFDVPGSYSYAPPAGAEKVDRIVLAGGTSGSDSGPGAANGGKAGLFAWDTLTRGVDYSPGDVITGSVGAAGTGNQNVGGPSTASVNGNTLTGATVSGTRGGQTGESVISGNVNSNKDLMFHGQLYVGGTGATNGSGTGPGNGGSGGAGGFQGGYPAKPGQVWFFAHLANQELWYDKVQKSNNTVASQTVTVTLPTGYGAGDLVIIFVSCFNTSLPTPPSGWTLTQNDSSGSRQRLHAIHKIMTGSEGSTVVVNVSGVDDAICAAAVLVHGVNTSAPINASAFSTATGASVLHATPAVTPSVNGCLIIRAVSSFGTSAGQTDQYNSWAAGATEICDFVGGPAADATPAAVSVAIRPEADTTTQPALSAAITTLRNYGAMTLAIAPVPVPL